MEDFTVEKGIAIQTAQLKEWQSVLKPNVFKKLQKWAVSKNKDAKDGYSIVRGQDLDVYISNELMTKEPYNY